MKPQPIISPVRNGKLAPQAAEILRRTLDSLEGKIATIEIKRYRKKRSTGQNAFYFGVVLPMVCGLFAEHGDNADPETVHRYLKGHVGGMKRIVQTPDGNAVWEIASSTENDTIDWEKWMDQIRAWAAPFGLIIPFPNEIAQ